VGRLRVLLADDHTIFLEGLRRLLEPAFKVVGAVEDGRALIIAAEKLQPDLILSDISMPMLNGIDAVHHLRRVSPGAKIIFLSMHEDASLVKNAFDAGASGYVLKRAASSELVTAIQEVLKGANFISSGVRKPPATVESLLAEGTLTPRQREILQLIAEGRSIKEISAILNISHKTVEFHKYEIMNRLGVRTTAELTKYAVKHGIVGL
jgi:DNA-binding NarL/FixJ family response regulator